MLVDSHAHLNFSAFDQDIDQVSARCRQKGMKVINVGSQAETSQKAVALAEKFPGFFAATGIHPIHLGESRRDELETAEHADFSANPDAEFNRIVALADQPKVVAIGETGLDYFRLEEDVAAAKKIQREYFCRHLELAKDKNLPVILHARGEAADLLGAYQEILEIVKTVGARGVIHCFGADWPTAEKFLDLGFYIGLTGIITFRKKAEELQLVAKNTPLDKILIETDSPYLAPEPHRGERNEPVFVELVAAKIAEIKSLSLAEVIEQTGQNAAKLFKI